MKSTNRLIVAMLVVAALGAGFWILALGPKRKQASDLAGQVSTLKATLAQDRQDAANAASARAGFPSDYRQLVVLGKAVPGNDDTASLLVELNQIADRAQVRFKDLELNSSPASSAAPVAAAPSTSAPSGGSSSASAASTPASAPSSPTETVAATLPLGATIGPAGLGVMPYTLTFTGDFFHIADFVKGLEALVKTTNSQVAVNGRLVTVDGFALTNQPSKTFPHLQATFAVTTYLTPPSQGVTAGATPSSPAATASSTATPTSTTTGGAP